MKYAHYNEITKELLGYYDSEIHETIPTPNIEISDEAWQEAISINATHVKPETKEFYKLEPEELVIQEPKIDKITLRQTKLILNQMGLLSQVETYINSIENEQLKATAKIEWEYANNVERNNPLITTLQTGLNLSDEQVDNMFEQASKL
ncbi:hypothetical protein [Campylobacter hyointestinalis]|uniref:hypothetical protein n=1 Tax=Campylobacter hyointestinalis TaxID=198 RepID=UPI000DCD4BBC|nr:hypothetical protein [Campylobacter hyointestinalis]RAZ38047.1 hypothetical protein CHL9426_07180 [Campylobacter hyointestinalis subsp. lawsonii]RAZ54648.1 hypothetical protein CHL10074_06660 [Campylobacter hyointestinalis subsp. lawsonii]RAZ63368.1 hypothetical protein CHL9767_06965 [Campylobacter hyointestinalis subsp. lawsonii]